MSFENLDSKENQIQGKNSDLDIAQKQIENLIIFREQKSNELLELQQEYETLQGKFKTLESKNALLVQQLGTDLPQQHAQMTSIEKRVDALTAQNAGDSSLQCLYEKLSKLETDYQKQCETKENDIANAEHLLIVLSEKLNQWTEARNRDQEKQLELEKRYQEAKDELETLQAKGNELLLSESIESSANKLQIEAMESEIATYKAKCNAQAAEIARLSNIEVHASTLKDEYELILQECDALRQNETQRELLVALQSDNAAAVAKLEAELGDANKKIVQIEDELLLKNEQLGIIPVLQEEIISNTENVKRIPRLLEEISGLRNAKTELEAKLKAAPARDKDLENEVLKSCELEKQVKTLQNKLERMAVIEQHAEELVRQVETDATQRTVERDAHNAFLRSFVLPLSNKVLQRSYTSVEQVSLDVADAVLSRVDELLAVCASSESAKVKINGILRSAAELESKLTRACEFSQLKLDSLVMKEAQLRDMITSMQQGKRHTLLQLANKERDVQIAISEVKALQLKSTQDAAIIKGLSLEKESLKNSVTQVSEARRELESAVSLATVELESYRDASAKALADLETARRNVDSLQQTNRMVLEKHESSDAGLRREIKELQLALEQQKKEQLLRSLDASESAKAQPMSLLGSAANGSSPSCSVDNAKAPVETVDMLSRTFMQSPITGRKRLVECITGHNAQVAKSSEVLSPPFKQPKLSFDSPLVPCISPPPAASLHTRAAASLTSEFDTLLSPESPLKRSLPLKKVVIGFSGFKNTDTDDRYKWTGRMELERQCRLLGATILTLDDNRFDDSCTHIIIVPGTKTKKSLCAIAAGCWIISDISWVSASVAAGHFVDETAFGKKRDGPMFVGKKLFIHRSALKVGEALIGHVKAIFVECGKGTLSNDEADCDYILVNHVATFQPLYSEHTVVDLRSFFSLISC